MTWPNSLSNVRTLPGNPLNFPRVPANDNFRPVTRPWRPALPPANDNVLRTPRLGSVARLMRFGPTMFFATTAITGVALLVAGRPESYDVDWPWLSEYNRLFCPSPVGGDKWLRRSTLACQNRYASYSAGTQNAVQLQPNVWVDPPSGISLNWVIDNWRMDLPHPTLPGYYWHSGEQGFNKPGIIGSRTGPTVRWNTARQPVQLLPSPLPQILPPPPKLSVGRYEPPYPIYPEWSDHGPRAVRQQHDKGLISTPPPSRTKERKVRVRSHAVGRAIEFAISQATESLDMLHAVFEALPMWLKMKYINAARWREHKYNSGRIIGARLRYRALTPQEKIKILYDHYDQVDTLKATQNILASRGSDRAWAKIGQQMGAFQRGPWDSSGRDYMDEALRELDEFDPYFPDLEKVPSEHSRAILEEHTKMEYDEYRRLYDRLSSYQPRG